QALSGEPAEGPSGRQRPMFGPGFVLIWVLVWLAVSAGHGQRFVATGASGAPELRLVGLLGRDVRTSGTTAFRGAAMTTVMGMTRLDLRRTTMAGTQATVDVLGVMGGVEIVVPPSWIVDVQTTAVMGGVRDRRSERPPDDSAAPRLVVRGVIVAGGLTIQS
ncbi:MAG: LiaF domain-containing protein, partial [Vicinamibacterales bacterium]